MSNAWFRMYCEFATDPKVQSMPEAMQRRLVMLFCLQGSGDLEKLSKDEIAFALRIDDVTLHETLHLFQQKGFCDQNGQLTNWNKRQYKSDSSAERVKKYRDKTKASKDVTPMKRYSNAVVTPPDTDTDTDTEVKDTPSGASFTARDAALNSVLDSEEPKREQNPAVKWIEAFDEAGGQAYPNEWGISNRRMVPAGNDFTTATRLMAMEGATLEGWAVFCLIKLTELASRRKRAPGSLSYLETAYADHLQGLGEPIVGAAIVMTPDQIAKDAAREARMQAIREGRA